MTVTELLKDFVPRSNYFYFEDDETQYWGYGSKSDLLHLIGNREVKSFTTGGNYSSNDLTILLVGNTE